LSSFAVSMTALNVTLLASFVANDFAVSSAKHKNYAFLLTTHIRFCYDVPGGLHTHIIDFINIQIIKLVPYGD